MDIHIYNQIYLLIKTHMYTKKQQQINAHTHTQSHIDIRGLVARVLLS